MDSESHEVTASHIDKLRAIISPPVAHLSILNGSTSPDTRRSKHGKDCQRPVHTQQRDSNSGLPSTVQDSQSDNIDEIAPGHLTYLSPNAVKKLQAMGSQPEFANGTQLISQGVYESIIQRNKSTRYDHLDTSTETQRSFEEGDSGHVDITSSFVTRPDLPAQLEDTEVPEEQEGSAGSDQSEFSPMPSQRPLTQFRESQRFKITPSAGVKRRYTGDVIDTPAPARNPLARKDQPLVSDTLRLSQAFAATQAPSSPFSNGLPTGPRSDRPSPNLELQTRLATTISSSPLLRFIPDHKRAATEPATRYVPMKLSQVERDHQEQSHMHENMGVGGDLEDDFDLEDSALIRERRQRDRRQKARQELKSLSSPVLPADPSPASSPPKVTLSDMNAEPDPTDSSTASPVVMYEQEVENVVALRGSEAETEREDDDIADIQQTEQLRMIEEDKESTSVLVPKTVQRRKPHRGGVRSQVDASPTIRNVGQMSATQIVGEMHSSEPIRIMDSQASQGRSYFLKPTKPAGPVISDVVDLMDQTLPSETSTVLDITGTPTEQNSPVHGHTRQASYHATFSQGAEIEDAAISVHQANTVPETSSDIRAGVVLSQSMRGQDVVTGRKSTFTTATHFQTAPTHNEANLTVQSSQLSSPIRTTPPGRKRRRMLEISAEASPMRLQSQPSFDAEAVLRLDDDQHAARLLESSPYRKPRTGREQVNVILSPVLGGYSDDIDPSTSGIVSDALGDETQGPSDTPDPIQHDVEHATPDVSQEIIKPGRLGRSQLLAGHHLESAKVSGPPLSERRSVFDIQASPEGKIVPRLQQSMTSAATGEKTVKRRANIGNALRMGKRLVSRAAEEAKPTSIDLDTDLASEQIKSSKIFAEELTADGSAPPEVVISPSMVFAHYKGDPRGYYPAKLMSRSDENSYQVQWEGYDPVSVDAYGVRALDVRLGDSIKVLADGYAKIPYVIRGFKDKTAEAGDIITDIRGHQTLLIAPKHRKSLPISTAEEIREIAVAAIYLDVNMWAQLKTRNHKIEPVASSVITSSLQTLLLRPSTPSTPSSRALRQTAISLPQGTSSVQGLFSNMAFAISYDNANQKNALSGLVQSNGGVIINDSFHDLLDVDTLQPRLQYANLGFTALLTDRYSRKEKYMQALALALPCLSGKWIETCVKHQTLRDWQSYLLPAGESAELDNATRSRVLSSVNATTVRLSEMIELRPNVLNGKDIIMVMGRGKAELKRAPYLFLVQALGAGRIHRVPDLKSAKDLLYSGQHVDCEWLFVDDKDVRPLKSMLAEGVKASEASGRAKPKLSSTQAQTHYRVAGTELILQSLILGKLYEAD